MTCMSAQGFPLQLQNEIIRALIFFLADACAQPFLGAVGIVETHGKFGFLPHGGIPKNLKNSKGSGSLNLEVNDVL